MEKVHNSNTIQTSLGAKAKSNWPAQRLFSLFICSKLSPAPRIKKGEQTNSERKSRTSRASQVKCQHKWNFPPQTSGKARSRVVGGFIPLLTMHVHNKGQMSDWTFHGFTFPFSLSLRNLDLGHRHTWLAPLRCNKMCIREVLPAGLLCTRTLLFRTIQLHSHFRFRRTPPEKPFEATSIGGASMWDDFRIERAKKAFLMKVFPQLVNAQDIALIAVSLWRTNWISLVHIASWIL